MGRPPLSMPRFRVGNRVQLMIPMDNIQPLTMGTIVSWFVGSSLYNVRFDGQTIVRVVDGSKLALVQHERARGK